MLSIFPAAGVIPVRGDSTGSPWDGKRSVSRPQPWQTGSNNNSTRPVIAEGRRNAIRSGPVQGGGGKVRDDLPRAAGRQVVSGDRPTTRFSGLLPHCPQFFPQKMLSSILFDSASLSRRSATWASPRSAPVPGPERQGWVDSILLCPTWSAAVLARLLPERRDTLGRVLPPGFPHLFNREPAFPLL